MLDLLDKDLNVVYKSNEEFKMALVAFCLLGGSGVLAYIICALIMPDDPTKAIDV